MKNRIGPLAAGVASVVLVAIAAIPLQAGAEMPSRHVCKGQKNAGASEREQERAARCLVDRVRAASGVRKLSTNRALQRAAGHKAGDLARCGFSHNACGRPADAWAKHFGYDSGNWRWGENLATGSRMSARDAIRSWLSSAPHRATLLGGSFEHVGVGLERSGGSYYWVLEVGCHGC